MVTKEHTRTVQRKRGIAEHHKQKQIVHQRAAGLLAEKERYLIVCEGEKTEPNYFKGFRLSSVDISIVGAAGDPLSVVTRAIELNVFEKSTSGKKTKKYDKVWTVFDRDSFLASRINAAFATASQNNIHVAFSNEAFELWYLLHFEYRNTEMTRTQYASALYNHLHKQYTKNSPDMYDILFENMSTAIANAKKLCAHHGNIPVIRRNPYTTVFKLVEELRSKL